MTPAPLKPSGLLLLLLSGAITAFGQIGGYLAAFREFDVDPKFTRFIVFSNLLLFGTVVLPITMLVLRIIRGKPLRPWLRTLLACAPSLVFALPHLGSGLVNPMPAMEAFAERMNRPLPGGVTELRSWYSHSPGESKYMFSFLTTPAATDELLQSAACEVVENPAMLDPELGVHFELPIGGYSVPNGWPKPKTWDGLKMYQSDQIKDYCFILTDASKTRVFVMVGDT
jgi:hypothetical protein